MRGAPRGGPSTWASADGLGTDSEEEAPGGGHGLCGGTDRGAGGQDSPSSLQRLDIGCGVGHQPETLKRKKAGGMQGVLSLIRGAWRGSRRRRLVLS